jgi:hypothetical protein
VLCAQPKRQKLLGIKPAAGGLVTDATLLSACAPQKAAIMMMGTCEEVIAADAIAAATAPPVLDDLEDISDEPVRWRARRPPTGCERVLPVRAVRFGALTLTPASPLSADTLRSWTCGTGRRTSPSWLAASPRKRLSR